jgi:probable rRNA maturation factor
VAAAGANTGLGPLEISILLAGDEEVRGLNRDYRKIDSPTNVLAFASGPPPPAPRAAPQAVRLLGDVVLAFGTMRREADERGLEMADHLAHLVVHGVLHLLGYDHEAAPDAEAMERAEAHILAGLGIADPYVGDENEGARPQRER